MKKLYIKIEGIHCEHCVDIIRRTLLKLNGIEKVDISRNVACIYGENLPEDKNLIEAIKGIGYETKPEYISTDRKKVENRIKWYEFLLIAGAIILIAVLLNLIFGFNIFNAIPTIDSSISYGMLFVIGLLTGIHCVSMCGAIGLYASTETNNVRSIKRPLLYNLGRVVSYTVIGGIVGAIGQVFSVSNTLNGIIILFAAVIMLLMALSMLGIINFKLPKIFKLQYKGYRLGAFFIGLLNGLMPCGPLQSMQIYALSTGSILSGALSMLLFSLGTVPLMFIAGSAVNLLQGKGKIIINKISSVLILILAVVMLNRGLLAFGIDVSKILPSGYGDYIIAEVENGVQTIEFDLDYDSYADIVVQKDIPVKMIINADKSKITGCNNEVISSEFGFDKRLSEGENEIEFTPAEEGDFTYTCWMNMIHNTIKVVDEI